jgi:ABC-type cobalamin transport system permease subunit
VIAMFVVLTGTTGMFTGVAVATGEEIGWGGFLVPELARSCRSPVSHWSPV